MRTSGSARRSLVWLNTWEQDAGPSQSATRETDSRKREQQTKGKVGRELRDQPRERAAHTVDEK